MSPGHDPAIESVEASAYRVPTDRPESDGTLAWDATTLMVVKVGREALGWAMLLEGAEDPEGGTLKPRRDRAGIGIALKESDAEEYRVA